MKIITLEEHQFNKYAENHKYRSYYQSSAYGKIMKKFGYDITILVLLMIMKILLELLYYYIKRYS